MDPVALLTQSPWLVLAAAVVIAFLGHLVFTRLMAGPAEPPAPSVWTLRRTRVGEGELIDVSAYEVLLEEAGENRIEVIKVLRDCEDLGLKEAKELAEAAPTVVTTCRGRAEAERTAEALRAAGARVRVLEPGTRQTAPANVYELVLESHGGAPIQAIKLVRDLTKLGLKEAKELVDAAPRPVKAVSSRQDAEALQRLLESQGARVRMDA